MVEGRYEVVVLVERALEPPDAVRLRALHAEVTEPVRFHVLLPVDEPAKGVEAAMSHLSSGEAFSTPAVALPPEVTEELRNDLLDECRARVAESVRALEAQGLHAVGEPVSTEPLQAVADKVAEVGGSEVVVVTRPHLVSELLRLDWSSRARRRLDVPVVHLVEHAAGEDG